MDAEELPLVIDEVPVLAAWRRTHEGDVVPGACELRVKESDRLAGVADGVRSLGGHAGDEGDDLVVPGGGLAGGSPRWGDHRMAMAFAVAALAAEGPSVEIEGMEAAEVSFPGFAATLRALGAPSRSRLTAPRGRSRSTAPPAAGRARSRRGLAARSACRT